MIDAAGGDHGDRDSCEDAVEVDVDLALVDVALGEDRDAGVREGVLG